MKQKDIGVKNKIKLNSEKVKSVNKLIKVLKLSTLGMLVSLIVTYFVLRVVYEAGGFSISMDADLSKNSGLIMYEKMAEKIDRKVLKATKVEYMDNISIDWLPENLNKEGEGSHNGDNYLAYSFYVENKGSETINYWYKVLVDDVVKNVDRAIRVMIYRNDEKTVYAKANATTGNAEPGTKAFYSEQKVLVESRETFAPGDIDKFTIVIFIEGDDPDCIDDLIGGAMNMHMDITAEFLDEEEEVK